jgi:hypothetical protein
MLIMNALRIYWGKGGNREFESLRPLHFPKTPVAEKAAGVFCFPLTETGARAAGDRDRLLMARVAGLPGANRT